MMRIKRILFLCFLILISLVGCKYEIENTKVSLQLLTCDYQNTPLGVDNITPYFGWKIVADPLTDVYQTAYQILVASCPKLLNKNTADVWDSKFICSKQSVQILFKGKFL